MTVKQISVFLENKAGCLAAFTKVLREHQIDMRALSIAETPDFGILRIIVNDTYKAACVLKEAEYIFSITPVLAVEVPDEAGSLYQIVQILGDNKMFNSMLFDNGDSKIIRKLAYSKILTDYLGLRFEDYIDQNRFDIFKEKIKYKTFDYYFQQEAAHPSMFVTNIYFFKDKFIKALVDLLYPSEKELVKQRFQKFFAEQKGGYPLYNGNYFTISYKAFKQYSCSVGV